jgi:DNA polymerase-3 subunit delta'
MTDSGQTNAVRSLTTQLCPWLRPSLEQLDAARASERLGHAWLLTGPPGVGKINLALAFASLLVEGAARTRPADLDPAEAVAAYARRHEPADRHPDIHWLFPEEDKRTISIEQVRAVVDELGLTSHGGVAKVAIIEPADAMTESASNALLKTLEQPAGDAYLLLLSDRPRRLLATIRSRCQRLDVARPASDVLQRWLGSPDAGRFAAAWQFTGGAPIPMAAAYLDSNSLENNDIADNIAALSRDDSDAQSLADRWSKSAPEHVLAQLLARLHRELRVRLTADGSTPITDPAERILHNAWAGLTTQTLFEQYDQAERLLNLVGSGSGVNTELALHALLLKFQPSRGRQ